MLKKPPSKLMNILITSATLIRIHLVSSVNQHGVEFCGDKALRVSELKCKEYSKLPLTLNEPQMSYHMPPPPGVYYVIGGKTAYFREFPHMAAIGWADFDGSYIFDCGGALVSSQFVLTAAHCTYSHGAVNPVPQVVRLGDHNIDSSIDDGASPLEVTIKTIHKHPAYTRKKHYNDIALLELSTTVMFSDAIRPVCIWTKELTELKWAIATGWGVTNPDTNEKAKALQKVNLSILSNEVCTILLKNNINRKWDQGIISSQMCAGEPVGGKDTCQGDSGSPLQIASNKYPYDYYIIGITSFGPRVCARLPAIYTKVTSYLDWIENIVWPEDYRNWTIINTYINEHE